MCDYDKYSREELIQEIYRLKEDHQKNDELRLDANILLEKMISLRQSVSDALAMLANTNVEIVNKALKNILNYFYADRAYIAIYDEENQIIDFVHEVTGKDIAKLRIGGFQRLPFATFPEWTRRVRQGETVVVDDTALIPESEKTEKAILQRRGILSTLVMPVFKKGKVIGFIGLDMAIQKHKWSLIEKESLRILADIVAIAIEKERTKLLIKSSSEELLKSEAKFRIIFDKLPLGIELFDENGKMLNDNNADLEIFGVKQEDLVGLSLFDSPIIPERLKTKLHEGEEIDCMLEYDFDKIHSNNYYKSDIRQGIKHLHTYVLPLKNDTKVFGFIALIADETQNFINNEKLKYSLAKLKTAVSTGNSFIWELDIEQDTVKIDTLLEDQETDSRNIDFIKHHQVSNLQEYLNTIHADDREFMEKQLNDIISGETDHFVASYRRILSGKLFWFHSIINAYSFGKEGLPNKIIGYSTDITEQRRKEEELLRVKEADKMKSAFLASMSHEIRTPLNSIVGFTDLVAETDDKEERDSYLSIIHNNTNLLLSLIDDILDFSKIEAGTFKYQMEKTNIKDICDELYMSNKDKDEARG
jgi:PAS domain S-box-containing protein